MDQQAIRELTAGPAADRLVHEVVFGYRWDPAQARWVGPDGRADLPQEVPPYTSSMESALTVGRAMRGWGYVTFGQLTGHDPPVYVLAFHRPDQTVNLDRDVATGPDFPLVWCQAALLALARERSLGAIR
jgi:hypothetical protein